MSIKNNTLTEWLDLTKCALEYPISRRKLQLLIYSNHLPAYRLGGKILFKRADLEKLLTEIPVGSSLDPLINTILAESPKELR